MYKHDNKLDVQRLGSESVYTESEDFEARKMINNRPKVTLERSEKDRQWNLRRRDGSVSRRCSSAHS